MFCSRLMPLALDRAAWLELNGYADDVTGPLQLEITKAGFWGLAHVAASHRDPSNRLSSILGLVSVLLGLLSIVLALLLT